MDMNTLRINIKNHLIIVALLIVLFLTLPDIIAIGTCMLRPSKPSDDFSERWKPAHLPTYLPIDLSMYLHP